MRAGDQKLRFDLVWPYIEELFSPAVLSEVHGLFLAVLTLLSHSVVAHQLISQWRLALTWQYRGIHSYW